jgi:hypothetical protein
MGAVAGHLPVMVSLDPLFPFADSSCLLEAAHLLPNILLAFSTDLAISKHLLFPRI